MANRTKASALPVVETIAEHFERDGRPPADIFALAQRADAGDASALEALREVYARVPEIVRHLGGLQHAAEQEILKNLGASAAVTIAAQAKRLRERLAGEDPTPLESLLVSRLVLDWLAATKAEFLYHQKMAGTVSFEVATFYERQADKAQRRFLRAATALAYVRKLLTPAVQLNVAEQQVNIAGTVNAGVRATS